DRWQSNSVSVGTVLRGAPHRGESGSLRRADRRVPASWNSKRRILGRAGESPLGRRSSTESLVVMAFAPNRLPGEDRHGGGERSKDDGLLAFPRKAAADVQRRGV